jgi:hypothetical protein
MGTAATNINVMTVLEGTRWNFRTQMVSGDDESAVLTHAFGRDAVGSVMVAMERGDSYAHWLADGQLGESPVLVRHQPSAPRRP